MTTSPPINGHKRPAVDIEPRFDPVALAKADAIRTQAEADAKAAKIKAEADADAKRTLAAEEAEKQRIANERAAMRLENEKAEHAVRLAEKAAKAAKANAEQEKAKEAAAEQEKGVAQLAAEQERTERMWKWGARAIYGVGLVIAAPVQFLAFWDPKRPFLVAAPALLEGLALVLAFGAAWAVAHRRDVMPYRVGIMVGALIAAGINMWHGATDDAIGLNAGLIGAIASLGGPIVLMAYEHGIAQKVDGIPSWREKRATARADAEERAEHERALREKHDAELAAAEAKALAESSAVEEQSRRDTDRQQGHPEVWAVAEAMRSARGAQHVTEQIWADAWQRVTGSKTVGITADIEARSRAAEARMTTVTKTPVLGPLSLVESHRPSAAKKAPDAPDGRRANGGTPPRRKSGDAPSPSPIARTQARLERTTEKDSQ